MKIRFTWNEYVAFAEEGIAKTFPNAVLDDTVQFRKYSTDGDYAVELPDFVEIDLDKPSKRSLTCEEYEENLKKD